jgi:uncharacterized protein YndB with AHSA1/START domain
METRMPVEPGISGTTVETVMNGPEWLVVAIDLAGVEPQEVIPWFVERDKLLEWWGDEHDIDPRFGGRYVIAWPRHGRTLRGQIVEIGARRLMLSWSFDHEPEVPPLAVAISASRSETGTRIEIRHGPWRDGDSDARDREGILEGWSWFLPKLAGAIRS